MVKLKKCPYCNIDLQNIKNVGSHVKWCDKNPKRQDYLDTLKKTRNKSKLTGNKLKNRNDKIKKAWERGCYDNVDFGKGFKNKKHTDETKKLISEKRKKYLKENPDKHPWKNSDKFLSKPCELFKEKLKDNNIIFVDEFQISDDRFYSIDISFPNKKIGIEINGNQHYDKKGNLKKYYNERHNYITDKGWILYEIHYSIVYKKEIDLLIDKIKKYSLTQIELDLFKKQYFNRINKKKCCKLCGKEIYKTSTICSQCSVEKRRKVERPSYEQLIEEISNLGYCGTGRKYGVSDNAVRKWKKQYEK